METLRTRFGDVLALRDLGELVVPELIAIAADLVAEGVSDPAVVELASLPADGAGAPFEIDAVVAAAREALGLARLSEENTRVRATQGQIRRWSAGELSDRALTRWAHGIATWRDGDPLWPLYVLDVRFDEEAYWGGEPDAGLRRELAEEARRLLALPDPWSAAFLQELSSGARRAGDDRS